MKELLDLKANVEANNQELENKNKTQEEIIKELEEKDKEA